MFDFSKSFTSDFDRNYFFTCYIILDEKYYYEHTFETQIIYIFFIKYYIK
jgi:hypothetical protein